MEKTYNYSNCTVRVLIPEKKRDIRKATEKFLKKVVEEREASKNEC